jgi:hypothetical protein
MKVAEWVLWDIVLAQKFFNYLKSIDASFKLYQHPNNGVRFWVDITEDGKVLKRK